MIKSLSISNFKSVKKLDIETSRVNIFIGEHNSGKSNILEALGWLSMNCLQENIFPEMFRFKSATDFFYDNDASKIIEVKTDVLSFFLRYARSEHGALMNHFEGLIYPTDADVNPSSIGNLRSLQNQDSPVSKYWAFDLEYNGTIKFVGGGDMNTPFKTYVFKKLKKFQENFRPFLNPPFGDNIPSLLISNKEHKDLVSSIFREKEFRLMLKPTENDINMAKDTQDELYSYPYTSISETLQRIVFYSLVIESNKDSIIIADEPDSNTFPMYTKQLAELIALDNSNQYFISTHNPYLLGSLLSKTPSKDISVFITEMSGYETKVSKVSENGLSELLDKGVDIYFNLDKISKG